MDQEFNKQLIWAFPDGPRLLKCPFRVLCIEAVGSLMPKTFHQVDEVIGGSDDLLWYVIDGDVYSYRYFTVIYLDPSKFLCVTPDFLQPD